MSASLPRIVLVINSLAPAGAERVVADLACHLDRTRWDVHVAVVRDGVLRAKLEDAGVPVHVIGGEFDWRWPTVVARMSALLKELRPTIVHTNLIGADIIGGLAARRARVPVVMSTQHDSYHRAAVFGAYRRWAAGGLRAVVAVSHAVAPYCESDLHVSPDRIHIIENGVDVDGFTASVGPFRTPPVIGAVGTLIPVKGHAVLLEAFAHVASAYPGAKLAIAGDGPERLRLETRAAALGIGDAVALPGYVSDMPRFLAGIDILAHPSRQEALSLAVLEGMSAGKPVVASDIPPLRALLTPSPTAAPAGILVPVGDARALADAIDRLASSPALAEEMGSAGRTRAVAHYSLARMVEQYEALYERLVAAAIA